MKTVYKSFVFIFLCTVFGACSNFLERSAQDLIIPTTTAHYKEMLQGEGYFKEIGESYKHIMLMTDDAEFFDATKMTDRKWEAKEDRAVQMYENVYVWGNEIESSAFTDGCFLYLYSQVMVANICLNAVDDTEGTVEEKEILRGQAAFTRAFAYFMLANIYSKPYNLAQPEYLCVPLKLDPTPDTDLYSRATVKEIWGLINTDIRTALKCLKDKDISSVYEINYKAVLALATRIALYMEDYKGVEEYGKEFLTLNDQLYDISGKTASIANNDQYTDKDVLNFIGTANKEIVFLFGGSGRNSYMGLFNSIDNIFYRVSRNTIRLYDYDSIAQQGDRRLPYWFMPPGTGTSRNSFPCVRYCHVPLKYDASDLDFRAQFALRTGEVYLSLAEAYARQDDPDAGEAIRYLNGLREKRIAPYTPLTVADFPTKEKLVEFVWAERRRELCFEEIHRWCDLRRQEQPEMVHKWKGNQQFRLKKNDPAYVLNFPFAERQYNPALTPNARPIREIETN